MNKTISRYIRQNIKYPILIEDVPAPDLGIIIVIPCHNEPDVVSAVKSIYHSDRPACSVEIIVVINGSDEDPKSVEMQNQKSYQELHALDDLPNWFSLYVIMNNNFSEKKAGVGLARKIGMDDAVRRFVHMERSDGVVVCYDADSKCDDNYLIEIEKVFKKPNVSSVGINYEHPIEGDEHPKEIYNYIAQYELHLRYFIHMQRMIDLPYAYHTVGSSMACKVDAYCAVGGMNQRKAGEDFYFLHKLIKYGGHEELNSTKVIPSPRVSDRVPFGTGKAVGDLQASDSGMYKTYNPRSFLALEKLAKDLAATFERQAFSENLPAPVSEYLKTIDGSKNLKMIIDNTTDYASFQKRFWNWFDAFQLMKYLHFARDGWYEDIDVTEIEWTYSKIDNPDVKEMLCYFRGLYHIK
mgnify:CR=1 FL=1|tara:strand:+ start:88 stop:1314 length:1227 start_codon:yes stop_codon:yes gene_type:complete